MPLKAKSLQEIRQACRLGPLSNAQDLEYWVETDAARREGASLRARIELTLGDNTDVPMLVYGHGGSGKSTELAKLTQELGSFYFPVSFSIRNEMNQTFVQPEDLLLVLAERLMRQAHEGGFQIPDYALKSVYDFFAEVTQKSSQAHESNLAVSAEASAGTSGIFGALFKLLATFKSEIKFGVQNEKTIVSVLRKRPADLLQQVNLVISAVRHAIPPQRRLLIIVEDLDKLDIASARRVFIENVNLLTGIIADIIYTVPIFTFHSPDASILRNQFKSFSLPMIKIVGFDGKRTPGFDVVRQIILARVDESAIDADALDLLVEKTGGVLQHAFEVLQNTALLDAKEPPLTKDRIELALKYKRNEFWSDISLPMPLPEGVVLTVNDLYQRLCEYAKRQIKGEKNPPIVDYTNQILLRSCALIEYNGEGWYGVHPLVIDNLRELCLLD